MLALEVVPATSGTAKLSEREEPARREGSVLVATLAIGVCGTDREIVAGEYGWPPPDETALVIGHESLGRVIEAPPGTSVVAGIWSLGSSAARPRCRVRIAP